MAKTATITVDLQNVGLVRDLLDRLAPDDPLVSVDADSFCWFCGTEGSVHADEHEHADDCPWVEARRLLGKPTE
jgi:hypothetical protein